MSREKAAGPHWIIRCSVALIALLLMVYAQFRAFAWDEGWHLVGAQSVLRGKRPYLDFCYPQTPLHVYWNALWLRVFGNNWHTAHAVASVMTTLAVLMVAGYLLRRFPAAGWRLPAAVAGVSSFGLNIMVVQFGTIAQAYAVCLFLITGAFLLTVSAVEREKPWTAAMAGLFSSAAANCSLLTAPVAPVLLVWLLVCNGAGTRRAKALGFVAGAAVPCLPLAWLFIQGPRQTVFNVLQYNLLYRQKQWAGAWSHNFGEWFAWIGSPQALALGMLSIAGLLFFQRRSSWDPACRREFYLCGWLALSLVCHISTATPTFRRYYLLAVPFLAILSCVGIYDIGCRLASPARPWGPVLVVSMLMFVCLGKKLVDGWNEYSWYTTERIAAKVKAVTPAEASLFADEPVYFVTRHAPPSGLELVDSHKLDFSPALAREFHVISQKEVERQLKARVFDVVEIADDDARIDSLGLSNLYAHCADLDDTDIFWGRRDQTPSSK